MTGAERPCTIIGMGCGHGARDRGSADGPATLRQRGVPDRLRLHNSDLRWMEFHAGAGEPLDVVAGLAGPLADATEQAVRRGRRPVVVGGDHSCAIGTWRGVRRALGAAEPFRLVWIDAHMDLHTPETSPSGALHGMPLACLLGRGHPRLRPSQAPILDPAMVTLLGLRSWEAEEAELAAALGVACATWEQMAGDLEAWLSRAAGDGRFGISLDLDAIDPKDAPGVGTPVPGGISAAELLWALEPFLASPACVGLEIAEFSPPHDIDHRTAALVEAILRAAVHPGEPP